MIEHKLEESLRNCYRVFWSLLGFGVVCFHVLFRVFFVLFFFNHGLKKSIRTVIIWYTEVTSLFPVVEVLAM